MFPDGFVAFVKRYEGLRLYAYRDQAGYPTIGYGHRIASMHTEPITEKQAEAWLEDDLGIAQAQALRCSPILAAYPRRLAAITDFCFNLGGGAYQHSTLRHRVDKEMWVAAARELNRWVHAHVNGKAVVLPWLVKRRAEMATWLQDG